MFKRPEELIMAILATLWIIFTYFTATYLGTPIQTALLIALLTLVWASIFFMLWQHNRTAWLWPLFLGLLVACWWPFLDWYAIRNIVPTGSGTIIVNKPWYASWTFKIILALLPTLVGYIWRIKQHRKQKFNPI